jgi:hypothetical protein
MVEILSPLDIVRPLGKSYTSLISRMEHILVDTDQWFHRPWATNITWLLVLVICHDHNVQITHVVLIRIVPCSLVKGLLTTFYSSYVTIRPFRPCSHSIIVPLELVTTQMNPLCVFRWPEM